MLGGHSKTMTLRHKEGMKEEMEEVEAEIIEKRVQEWMAKPTKNFKHE